MADPTADEALSLPVPVLTAEERERATALFRVAKRMNPSLDSDDALAVRCIEIAAHPDTALGHKLLEVVRRYGGYTAKKLLAEAQRRVEASR